MTLAELTDSAIDYIIAGMDESRLSEWELGFFESVSDQWARSRSLSDKQKLKLGDLWDSQ